MLGGVFILFFGLIFFLSGLIVNTIQLLSLVVLWPISRDAYRRFNAVFINCHWQQFVWLAEWWAGCTVKLYGDPQDYEGIGKERAIALCNHRSDVDWLFGWVLAEKKNCLGGTKCMMKIASQYLPVLGWSWWFLEYVFLKRKWDTDKQRMHKAFESMRSFPIPFWIVVFAEGTRYTEEKYASSVAYAKANNLPVLKHLLLPKTKGFVSAVQHTREVMDVVYDCTFAFPVGAMPTIAGMLQGKGGEVHIHVKRHDASELPAEDADVSQWCRDLYVRKDERLEFHRVNQKFEGPHFEIKRHWSPLLFEVAWALLLTVGSAWFLHSAWVNGNTTALYVTAAVVSALSAAIAFAINYSKVKPEIVKKQK